MIKKGILYLFLLQGMIFSIYGCSSQLSGAEAKAYILNPENELTNEVFLKGKLYRLSYWPEALSPGAAGRDLIYFELSTQDGRDLFAFTELDFQMEHNGVFIPATIVLPENFGSSKNHLLIGFQRPEKAEEIRIQIGSASSAQLVRFKRSDIQNINKRIQQS